MAVNDDYYRQQGWVKVGDGYVPPDHPLAKQAQTSQPQTGVEGGGGYQAQPAGQTTIQGQATAAQTYSTTPGAAPTGPTSNQGVQDVARNTYLQRATQATTIDRNAPEFKQQVDAFAAGQDRARRQYESEQAERLSAQGLANSGAMDTQRRVAAERAGMNMGAFEAQLVQRELENRRAEIADALTNLRGMITSDQAAALQRELATLDAAIKREGLAQSGDLGARDLAIKDKLGTGALNVDLLRALLQNEQFNTGESRAWAEFDWKTSPLNPANW